MPEAKRCTLRIAVVRRDGERAFVDEYVTTSFGMTTQRHSIYRFGRHRCTIRSNGCFIVERTGEKLRRVPAVGPTAFMA